MWELRQPTRLPYDPFLFLMKIRRLPKRMATQSGKSLIEVVAVGDTYALDPRMSRDDALTYWFAHADHAYVAEADGTINGALLFGLTDQVAGPRRKRGIHGFSQRAWRGNGRAMAEHCLKEARRLGFRAMQFNFVISTNPSAIRLWQDIRLSKSLGILSCGAFRHPEKGYVDVYVMYRLLVS